MFSTERMSSTEQSIPVSPEKSSPAGIADWGSFLLRLLALAYTRPLKSGEFFREIPRARSALVLFI